jgi:hypothetical protein
MAKEKKSKQQVADMLASCFSDKGYSFIYFDLKDLKTWANRKCGQQCMDQIFEEVEYQRLQKLAALNLGRDGSGVFGSTYGNTFTWMDSISVLQDQLVEGFTLQIEYKEIEGFPYKRLAPVETKTLADPTSAEDALTFAQVVGNPQIQEDEEEQKEDKPTPKPSKPSRSVKPVKTTKVDDDEDDEDKDSENEEGDEDE